jgi:predicted ATPase
MSSEEQPGSLINLERFREKVAIARHKAGHLQKELASALGIEPQVLSRKLHGAKAFPTNVEVKKIICNLAGWDGLTTQAEAIELLRLMGMKAESFSRQEWEDSPLNRLEVVQSEEVSIPVTKTEHLSFPPLPASPTSLLGRKQHIEVILELLRRSTMRLLTLRGIGGVGKTQLALEVARQAEREFADGVFFVLLATIKEVALVPSTIIQALHLPEPVADRDSGIQPITSPEDLLKSFLQGKKMLLVLDNVEQIPGIAHFISGLLSSVATLKILVTSRTTVNLYGEHEFEVPPLEIYTSENAEQGIWQAVARPAIQLFIERARAVNATFQINEQNLEIITQICARLDGLPLAIELAAVRTKVLPLSMILQRLTDGTGQRLTFLRSKALDVPERHQTLYRTLHWSYELLDTQQQQLFRQLSVFVGGWTLDAALKIGLWEEQEPEADEMLEQMETLINHSLIKRTEWEEAEREGLRFYYLETIREYGLGQLEVHGERKEAQRRHALYYLKFVEEIESHLVGREQSTAVSLLAYEQDNLRAALAWGMEQKEAEIVQRLCGTLGIFWEARTQFHEAHRWIDQALKMSQETPARVRGKLLMAASRLALWETTCERSRELAQEALALYEAEGDQAGKMFATFQIGDTWHMQGEYALASGYLEESLLMQREQKNWRSYGFTLSRLGAMAFLQQDFASAWVRLKEGEMYQREYSEPGLLNVTLVYLGVLALIQGDTGQSTAYLREGLLLAQHIGNRYMLATDLIAFGCVLGTLYGAIYAAKVCSAAEALFESINTSLPAAYRPLYNLYLGSLKSVVGESTWETWWMEGKQLSAQEVSRLALETSEEKS